MKWLAGLLVASPWLWAADQAASDRAKDREAIARAIASWNSVQTMRDSGEVFLVEVSYADFSAIPLLPSISRVTDQREYNPIRDESSRDLQAKTGSRFPALGLMRVHPTSGCTGP